MDMIRINQNQKIKFLILVLLLKRQITILRQLKQRVKFLMLLIQQQKPHSVSLKIKYLVLVVLLKTDYDTKITEIENTLNNHNHDKYITTPEFNTLAADFLMQDQHKQIQQQKQILIILYQALIVKLLRIKQKIRLLRMN